MNRYEFVEWQVTHIDRSAFQAEQTSRQPGRASGARYTFTIQKLRIRYSRHNSTAQVSFRHNIITMISTGFWVR